jgi:hypothetical protein
VTREHRVDQGESMLTIAAQYGIPDWRTIFDDPGNSSLKEKRNPQILHPGDVVVIPGATESAGTAAKLDGRIVLVRRGRNSQPLRVKLSNVDFSPMAGIDFTLSFGKGQVHGTTDADGWVSAQVPLDIQDLRLETGDHSWDLAMGHLNPLEETDDHGISGAQGRLKNLGYFDGEIDGKTSPELESALRRFQLQHDIPRTGELDDATSKALAGRHGS